MCEEHTPVPTVFFCLFFFRHTLHMMLTCCCINQLTKWRLDGLWQRRFCLFTSAQPTYNWQLFEHTEQSTLPLRWKMLWSKSATEILFEVECTIMLSLNHSPQRKLVQSLFGVHDHNTVSDRATAFYSNAPLVNVQSLNRNLNLCFGASVNQLSQGAGSKTVWDREGEMMGWRKHCRGKDLFDGDCDARVEVVVIRTEIEFTEHSRKQKKEEEPPT